MEERLQEQNWFLDSLLNAIPIPIFFKDTEARYAGFNTAYEEFYGKTREELIGKVKLGFERIVPRTPTLHLRKPSR